MKDFTVLWDGAKSGPGGAYLFAQQLPVKPAPSLVAEVSDVDAVRGTRDHFRDQWFTAAEMAQVTGLSPGKAHAAMWCLVRYDEITRERKGLLRRSSTERQRYRFVP